ncbi:MAG: nucleotidyltransferase [Bacteroidota bacterium]
MARTLNELITIYDTAYASERAAAGLPVDDTALWSRVSRKRFLRMVHCLLALTQETIFDIFKADVDAKLRELKPHTERWYANKSLAYQYGFNLLPDSDLFDNTGYTDAQIAASKVVKYAAVVEQENQFGRVYLRIKLAGETAGDLAPLTAPQLAGVKEYLKRIKDAGVKLQVDSLDADNIKMKWTVYYDPLILDANGNRLDGTASNVVKDAIKGYLKKLPFNGIYVIEYHIDEVQLVEGVVIAEVTECQTKYGLLPFTAVQVKTTPDAGYLRFIDDSYLEITYIPQSQIR